MKCPKCGYERQPSDNRFAPATECPACGVVYAKTGSNGSGQPHVSGTIKKPSPVNEESLKRARERVEKRLRQQMETGQPDESREQTLQRARVFAADGVRQRQETWKRQQLDKKTEPDDLTMAEAAIRVKDPTIDLTAFKDGSLTMFGVIRPEMGPKEANDEQSKREQSSRKSKSSVSLSDSLAQLPPGDNLPSEKPPIDAAQSEIEPKPSVAATADVSQISGDTSEVPAPLEKESSSHTLPEAQSTVNTGDNGLAQGEEIVKRPAEMPLDPMVKTLPPEKGTIPSKIPDVKIDAPAIEEAPPIVVEAPFSIDDRQTQPANLAQVENQQSSKGLMGLLPTVAWLILVSGLVGAVLSWTTLNDVQAGVEGAAPTGTGAIPVALLLGFAYLATGVLGFAFFWVCAMISGQLKDIQRTLQLSAPRQEKEKTPA